MIFVVADPAAGRLLASQLRFYGAGDIPVYATSEIFDVGRAGREGDLNGFIFADTPALLAPDDDASGARADLQAFWPQRTGLFRFYGMGFDAYELIPALYASDGTPLAMQGMSGDLALDAQGRIRRVNLPLAQFRSGRPVALDVAAPQPIDSSGLIGQR